METVDRGEVSLEKLRAGDGPEWEKAYPLLWEVAWRTVSKVSPHSTDAEKEEFAAAGLTGKSKVVYQITNPNPTQDAFLKAASFADILNLTATVVRNSTIDELRKLSTRDDEKNQRRLQSLFGPGANPSDESERRERNQVLAIAVAELNEFHRQLIEDFYFHELKTKEIASKRKRPRGTVCVELQRARAQLRISLEGLNE